MTGLVLEGGAMRGLFTAGVLDVLMENGIWLDGTIGVSAGAVFGCNYKSKQIGRVLRYNKRFCRDWRYAGVRSLLLTGDLFGAEFCYRMLPQKLDLFDYEGYAANPMPFYAVATDAATGKAVYRRLDRSEGESMEWFRASASMPLASRTVKIAGGEYLDGGIADSIPLPYFESIGYERNLVVLTQPEGYVKKPARAIGVMKWMLRRYPGTVQAMTRRHEGYNAATAYVRRREEEGRALVIRPDAPLEIGRLEHDAQRMQRVYDLGREAALKRLDDIRSFVREEKA